LHTGKKVLQSFVISKVIYYSPLLGSNKSRTARIQTLINTDLFWCIGSFFSKNGKTNSEKQNKNKNKKKKKKKLY